MTNEARRRLTTLLVMAMRAGEAKEQGKLEIGDPAQTIGMAERVMREHACELAFSPVVCEVLAWMALRADEGEGLLAPFGRLEAALAELPDIDDPFMWGVGCKEAFQAAGFDFDKREWKADEDDDTPAEFDFSKAQRGKYVGWTKDGYSYPCGLCEQTGKVSRITGEPPFERYETDCPKCSGTARIVVTAEEAKAERAEAEPVREAARERLRRELEAPPECGCEPDPDMVHDESCPAWCGEPKETQ